MKNSTPISVQALIGAIAIYAISATSHGAAYIKLKGIEGESKSQQADMQVEANVEPRPVGLLLPAVQQVREAARRPTPNKDPKGSNDHSAGDEHEVTYDVAAGV